MSATLTGTLVDPGGVPQAGRPVVVTLGGNDTGHTPSGEVVGHHVAQTDDTGTFTVTVPLNSTISPDGTWWTVSAGDDRWTVVLDTDGTFDVGDSAIQVVVPVPPDFVPGPVSHAELQAVTDSVPTLTIDPDGYLTITQEQL